LSLDDRDRNFGLFLSPFQTTFEHLNSSSLVRPRVDDRERRRA
jgi:hypothetical protein